MNKNTQRINGLYLANNVGNKFTCNRNIEHFKNNLCKIISYLCFKNKPINILNIVKEKDENRKINKITLNMNSYKIDYDLNVLSEYIFLTNKKLNYSKPLKTEENEDENETNKKIKYDIYKHKIEETGIINNENYKFYVPHETE